MRFDVITLFPELVSHALGHSITGRALEAGHLTLACHNPRDVTKLPHNRVDDSPYGGGSGMVLACQPLWDCYQAIPKAPSARVIFLSPAGQVFNQAAAKTMATAEQLVFLCGHYEGIDERLHTLMPEMESWSIGDYVLTGGELPALVMMDTVSRLIPGVVQKMDSVERDSFFADRLDYPVFTRPPVFEDLAVPDVLRSGDHKAIAQWQAREATLRTARHRPDLFAATPPTAQEQRWLTEATLSLPPTDENT